MGVTSQPAEVRLACSDVDRVIALTQPSAAAGGNGGLDPALDHPPFAVDQFQFHQSGKELNMVPPLGSALLGHLVEFSRTVSSRDCRCAIRHIP